MDPESSHSAQKRRYRLTVACIAVVVSLIAVGAALAIVPTVRDHLCYEHRMNMFCLIAQISESEVRVFAWHPEMRPSDPSRSNPNLDRTTLTPRSALSEIAPDERRVYGSRFPSGQRQWLYWEARLKSHEPPGRSIRFVVQWTTYAAGDHAVAGGVVEATWAADEPVALIIGPVDTVPIGTGGQFPPGHYEIVLKMYGNQLGESEVRGGLDIS